MFDALGKFVVCLFIIAIPIFCGVAWASGWYATAAIVTGVVIIEFMLLLVHFLDPDKNR